MFLDVDLTIVIAFCVACFFVCDCYLPVNKDNISLQLAITASPDDQSEVSLTTGLQVEAGISSEQSMSVTLASRQSVLSLISTINCCVVFSVRCV